MDGFKLRNIVNIIDLVVISYLIDTFVLVIFLPDGMKLQPMIFRIAAFFAISFIIYHNKKEPNKITNAIRFFYPIALLSYIYGETAIFNTIFFRHSFDFWLSQIELQIFGFQPALEFANKYNSSFIYNLMYFSYLSYYLFIIGFSILAWRSAGEIKEKNMFIIINSFIIYYMFFIIFPSHGPQYYLLNGQLSEPQGIFAGTVHLIQLIGEAPTGAFPSSHVGMMVIFVIMAARNFKKALPITIIITVLILFSTVYIQAHYAVDVVAGVISAPILYWISSKFFNYGKKILDEELTEKTD